MKSNILIFAIIALVVGMTVKGFGSGMAKTTAKSGILTVSDVQTNPNAYKGSITITGVVAKFSKEDPKLFAIIDTAEAKHCKSLGCAKFSLPVKYENAILKKWDEINVTGHFVEKGGLLFEATKIEIVKHLNF